MASFCPPGACILEEPIDTVGQLFGYVLLQLPQTHHHIVVLYLIGCGKYFLKHSSYLLWLDCGSIKKQAVIEATRSYVQNC